MDTRHALWDQAKNFGNYAVKNTKMCIVLHTPRRRPPEDESVIHFLRSRLVFKQLMFIQGTAL